MKNIKMSALILIVCLTFAACSPNNTNSNENENSQSPNDTSTTGEVTETTTESYYKTLGERDFGGDTFSILDANDLPDWFHNFAEEITGDSINDAMYERDKFIEEQYNVNLEYTQLLGGNNGCSTFEKTVMAGENTYDLLVSEAQGGALDMLFTRSNVLYNLTEAPYLSLQSPWWSKLLYENLQFNNKMYYTGGDIFLPSFSQAPAAMYFNKKLFQEYGVTDNLYNLVLEGKWTLDVLSSIIKERNIDLDQDGKMNAEDDFYGMINTNNSVTTNIFCTAVDIKFSTVKDNTIEVNLNSSDYIAKIDKLANIVEKINFKEQNNATTAFKNGKAMFLVQCLIVAQINFRDMEDDFGILPMPKWDEKQENYRSYINAWSSGFVAVPGNADDIEKTAFLMEAMAYRAYEKMRPVIYDSTLKAKVSRDEESEKMIDIILETCYLDLNSQYNFGGSIDIINNAIIENKPFVSEYEKKESVIQKDISNFIEAMSKEE